MTDEEAQKALQALREHYRQPVLPLGRFCDALKTWFRAIEKRNIDPALHDPHRSPQGKDYHTVLRLIERDIRKSNLLYRLIYEEQKLRTDQCPVHKGHWTGADCECDGTGWLREPEDRPPPPEKIGAWTSADMTTDGTWWKWKRSDGAVILCHMNGLQLKGWIAQGPEGGSQTFRKTPGGSVVMFENAELARQAVDEKYPLQ